MKNPPLIAKFPFEVDYSGTCSDCSHCQSKDEGIFCMYHNRETTLESHCANFDEFGGIPHAYTVPELLNLNIPKPNWIVDGILAEKSIAVFGGAPESFKSLTMLDLALSIASGRSFLNHFPTSKKKKVLYIDKEMDISLIKERVKNLTSDPKDYGDCMFLCGERSESVYIDASDSIKMLEKLIKTCKPDVIILDSLVRTIQIDESDAKQISRIFRKCLSKLRTDYGITICLVHHTRKRQMGHRSVTDLDLLADFRGSGDLGAMPDICYMNIHYKAGSFIFRQIKNRYGQKMTPKAVILQPKGKDEGFDLICTGDANIKEMKDEICAKEILQWLHENKKTEFKRKVILEAMKKSKQGHSKATCDRALKILVEEEKLIKSVSRRGWYQIPVEDEDIEVEEEDIIG